MDAHELVEFVHERILEEYGEAVDEGAPWDSEEDDWLYSVKSTSDVLDELGFGEAHPEAREYVRRSLPDNSWCQRDFYRLHPYSAWQYGWTEFVAAVKHRTHYLFFEPPKKEPWEDEGEIRPSSLLKELGRLIRRAKLVRTLPRGTMLHRVRVHGNADAPSTLADLGPPPADKARYANRLNPAGISMLYAAEDETTAFAETVDPRAGFTHATVATLRLEAPIRIVDFVGLPPVPGYFAPGVSREQRAGLSFVHSFARELSQPIERDGREHIEYVPTQVVTEYLRFRFRSQRERVYGLRYSSSKREGGVNLALFVGHEDLVRPPRSAESCPVPLTLVGCRRVKLSRAHCC